MLNHKKIEDPEILSHFHYKKNPVDIHYKQIMLHVRKLYMDAYSYFGSITKQPNNE
jgi:hypothetical protein